ncbi:MAG: stage III sporulation protein AF [Firmicutes bacterium]|mgnify:CR=1 FL=1|jgi:stage III sporulation protein AF|nr:stage III sporulation protein AF [Bacillota bacterium]
MISAVTEWIRAVLLVSFLSVLVRLLLPDNGLRPFVRLVTGLVVLSVLVQPILVLVGAVPGWDGRPLEGLANVSVPSTAASLAAGEAVRDRGRQAAVEQVRMHVRSQIEALVSLVAEVDGVRVEELVLSEDGVDGLALALDGRRDPGEERVRELLFKYFGIDPDVVTLRWTEEGA